MGVADTVQTAWTIRSAGLSQAGRTYPLDTGAALEAAPPGSQRSVRSRFQRLHDLCDLMNSDTETNRESNFSLVLDSGRVFRSLLAVIGCLVLASTAGQVSNYAFGHGRLFGLVRLFYLDGEQTIPASFSSLQLLAAAGLIAWIARAKRDHRDPYALHWAALALGFVALAIDENCAMHEKLALGDRVSIAHTGVFYFGWVLPALVGVAVIGAMFVRFVFHLPSPIRNGFIVSALLFVGGAVGVEMLEAKYAEKHGVFTPGFVIYVTIEETLELVGIANFIRVLLVYLESLKWKGRIAFGG